MPTCAGGRTRGDKCVGNRPPARLTHCLPAHVPAAARCPVRRTRCAGGPLPFVPRPRSDPAKYLSALLLSLSTMLHLEMPQARAAGPARAGPGQQARGPGRLVGGAARRPAPTLWQAAPCRVCRSPACPVQQSAGVRLPSPAPQVNVLSKMDLIEQYGELAFGLDFYLHVRRHAGRACAQGGAAEAAPARKPVGGLGRPRAARFYTAPAIQVCVHALLPSALPLPPLQAQGLAHLAEAMEGSFPPRFQRMTEELCEVGQAGRLAGAPRLPAPAGMQAAGHGPWGHMHPIQSVIPRARPLSCVGCPAFADSASQSAHAASAAQCSGRWPACRMVPSAPAHGATPCARCHNCR